MASGSTDVVVRFVADADQLNKSVSGIGRSIGGLGSGLKVLGGAVAGAFAVDQVTDFVGAAEEAQVASKRLAKLLQNAGDETGVWAKNAEDLASTLQDTTGIDDEVIKGAQGILATFHGVSGGAGQMSGAFKRATKAALDMSKAGFGDAQSAAVQLGKALEDPVKGIAALGKSGITFSEDQKKMIKTMVETGDKAGAMNVILANVESQVGGTAEATVTASDKMSVAWGETQEAIGNLLLPAVAAITPAIQTAAAWVQATLIPAVRDLADRLADRLGPAVSTIVDWFQLHFIPAVGEVVTWIQDHLIPAFGDLATWLVEHKDDIAGYLTPFIDPAQKVVDALVILTTSFADFAVFIVDHVQPVLSALGDWMNKNKDDTIPALALVITVSLTPAFFGLATAAGAAVVALAGVVAAGAAVVFVVGLVAAAIVIAGRLLGGWGDAFDNVRDKIGWVIDKIETLIQKIGDLKSAIGDLAKGPSSAFGPLGPLFEPGVTQLGRLWPFAEGGIVTRPTLALIGEAGPEAVIPLSRASSSSAGGGVVINVHTTGLGADAPSIQSAVVTALRQYTSRNGPLPGTITGA